ncbi:MAG: DUF4185 domain-containing protein [Polyangiaceae bacterium]
MRAELWRVPALALLAGCSVNIGNSSDAPAAPSPVLALSGCLPLADRVSTLSGGVSVLTVPEQGTLVVASSATVDGTESSVAFADASGACLTHSTALSARPIIDCSKLGRALHCHPKGSVSTGPNDVALYFSADHADDLASDGVGIAHWDASAERFIADSLLWTSDPPDYGSAAALVSGNVYVFGGIGARFLAADVYLARVPSTQLSEPSAYEYWQGGGSFGSDPDSARPVVEGGISPSVAWDEAHQRWLMLYATPLADSLTARTGLGITGPWSAPYTLGHCALPASDPGAFCTNVVLTPALANDGELAFTHAAASFSRPAHATDRDFWTRLVRTAWPSELP